MNKPARNKHRTDHAVKDWCQKINEQQASGGEFCRQRNLCLTSFYAWRKAPGDEKPRPHACAKKPCAVARGERSARYVGTVEINSQPGFLQLDSPRAFSAQASMIEQRPRVLWIETSGG